MKIKCPSCLARRDEYPVNLKEGDICFKCSPEEWQIEFEIYYAEIKRKSQAVMDRLEAKGVNFEQFFKGFLLSLN